MPTSKQSFATVCYWPIAALSRVSFAAAQLYDCVQFPEISEVIGTSRPQRRRPEKVEAGGLPCVASADGNRRLPPRARRAARSMLSSVVERQSSRALQA